MTAPPLPNNSLRRLNRFDFQLWNRFVAIAQPYWYPIERGSSKIFFLLILLLLVFVFSLLAVLISTTTLLFQQLYPDFMNQTASGLVSMSQGLTSSPLLYALIGGLLVPAIAFFLVRDKIRAQWKPWLFLGFLLLLSFAVSGLNVVISYIGNFFTTALSERDQPTYWRFLFVYAGVFVVGTPIVVIYSYFQDLLGLFWRDWMTGQFLDKYFNHRSYYEINSDDTIDNPDQRISEDIKSFTKESLSYALIVLGAIIDLIAFTGILWSISRFLSIFLIGYALVGTIVIAYLGRRIIALNFLQLKREADFRYGMVHIRDNAESIAFYQGEAQEQNQVGRRFRDVVNNFNLLIGWQRNISVFTTAYRYAVIILPSAIMAPLYFAQQIKFGDISQAGFAFSQVFGAFSIFVLYIERLSAFAAGVNRLETFAASLNAQDVPVMGQTAIDTVERDQMALEHVTLLTPNRQRTLVSDLSVALEAGEGLVIVGQSGAGKSSILRAIAGLWVSGTGRIVRPPLTDMLFLPQRPYMVLGTLRDQLLYPHTGKAVSEEDLHRVLRQANLVDLPARVGGFEAELDWADVLSLGEQQRLTFARLLLTRPSYAILDEATSALDLANEQALYQQLKQGSTTFISVGHRPSLLQYHTLVLELTGDTNWRLTSVDDYQLNVQAFS